MEDGLSDGATKLMARAATEAAARIVGIREAGGATEFLDAEGNVVLAMNTQQLNEVRSDIFNRLVANCAVDRPPTEAPTEEQQPKASQ